MRFPRSLRFALLTATMALMLVPTLPASAQCTMGCSTSGQAGMNAEPEIQVDVPAANAMVSNGEILDIGGWSDGSRVDAYLDGPAGFGEGIGSAEVDKPRPDASSITGRTDSGFDLSWQPMDLTLGNHTLYLYTLIDGSWFLRTVPILGEGNFVDALPLDQERVAPDTSVDTGDQAPD